MPTIVIIGPGALGCLLAARLGAAGQHAIWFLDHDPARAAFLTRQGVQFTEAGRQSRVPVQATTDAGHIGPADLVLLCVKSYDVATSLLQARPLLAPTTLLISFQNGISHLDLLAADTGRGLRAVGVTAMGATRTGPGEIAFGGAGLTRIGFQAQVDQEASQRLAQAAATMTAAGMPTEAVPAILPHVWAKLLVNTGINALTALYDCTNGGLLDIPLARVQLANAVREAAAVAQAKGITLPDDDPVARTLEVCQATASNISSMLQDIRHHRRTEIDAINGAVVDAARLMGLPAPANEELVRRVKVLETGSLDPADGNFP
jgi:2-dehydropantoate 2-reductase